MKILCGLLGVFFLPACVPSSEQTAPELKTSTDFPFEEVTISPTPFPIFTSSPTAIFSSTPTPHQSASSTLTATPVPFQLCSPLKGYAFPELKDIESQEFIPPRPGKDDGHQGVDFAHWQYKDRVSLEGVEVQSVLSGLVSASVPEKYPYGNMIIIESTYNWLSPGVIATFQIQPNQSLYLLYAHLKAPSPFIIGDEVKCGDIIGNVGNTGASGNPHLHLETRVGPSGITFTSMEYYKTTSTDEERTNYESWRVAGEFVLFNPWLLLDFGE